MLAPLDSEEATRAVARVAVGERDSFQMGPALREYATAALAKRKRPLPRAAALVVIEHLARVADRRLKLVVGRLALGVDVAACRALLAIVRDSPEPEARALAESPLMRRIAKSS